MAARITGCTIVGLSVALTLVSSGVSWAEMRLVDVRTQRLLTLSCVLEEMEEQKIVFIGENHDQLSHHMAQLAVIQGLNEAGKPVAVGLEMFSKEGQEVLDQWVAGRMNEEDFKGVYTREWNLPWPLYSKIFEYARREGLPLVALNVPRALTRKVAREGFESLTEEEKRGLPPVVCRVEQEYMSFIQRAYGAHPHGQMDLINFCEAQLVWDSAMAVRVLSFLNENPEYIMVVIAGSGHTWKMGIPDQVRARSELPYKVILPLVPGEIEPGVVGEEDTDYIIVDFP